MAKNLFLPDQTTSDDADIAPKQQHVTVFGGKVYLTRKQVPLHYPISEHTLAMLASKRRGPKFYKPIDKALYSPVDLEAWIEASVVLPTAEPTAPKLSASARPSEPRVKKGRGRAKPAPQPVSAPGSTGRRLKSLPPTPNSWLRRND
jgi:hypothetical protein